MAYIRKKDIVQYHSRSTAFTYHTYNRHLSVAKEWRGSYNFRFSSHALPCSRSEKYFSADGRRERTEKRMINEELVSYGCGAIYSTVCPEVDASTVTRSRNIISRTSGYSSRISRNKSHTRGELLIRSLLVIARLR